MRGRYSAATVASQWLELIQQDIKGRLSGNFLSSFCIVCLAVTNELNICLYAALRRSKKRVRAVISTELPFLISKEFPSNDENDPYVAKSSSDETSIISSADLHQERWTKLFDQMDKALGEEEKQLVSILLDIVLFGHVCLLENSSFASED